MLFRKPKPIRAEALALIQAASSSDGPATFSAIALDGKSTLPVGGYEYPVVIDLSGLTTSRKMMVNLDHQKSQRVGHIVKASNDGKTLSLEGIFSAATPYRDEVIESHRSGMPWDVSVEVAPKKLELVKAGKSAVVNGNVFEGPVYVARKSELFGLAFVSQGAFESNQVSIAAMMDEPEMETTEADDEAFAKFAEEHGFDVMTMSEEERAALEVLFMQSQSSSDEPVTASFDPKLIRAEATKTYDLIEAKVLEYEDTIKDQKVVESIQAAAFDKMQSLKRIAAAERYTCDRFQKESTKILAELSLELIRAERPKGPAIHSSTRDFFMDSKFIQASLHIQSGREDLALKCGGEQVVEAARKTGPRSLLETCEAVIRASGHEVPRDRNDMLKMAFSPILASGFSNVSLPNILSNTMGRTLEAAYLEGTSTWRPFATIKSAADFKPQQSIRPSAAGNLQRIGAAGEIKHQVIGEEATYNWSVSTWAVMETITREDIVNDNLSYFNERPQMHGVAAARTVNDLIWRTIMSFSFTNTMTVPLLIGNLTDAVAKMKTQKDSQGNSIDIVPNTLAVPPELEGVARQALRSAELVTGVAGQGSLNPAYNIVPNLVVEPRLSNSSFTNWAVDNWYLFGGPMSSAVIVGYLNGQQMPIIETETAAFNTLGMSLRCYHDFGVAMGDGKASLQSNPT